MAGFSTEQLALSIQHSEDSRLRDRRAARACDSPHKISYGTLLAQAGKFTASTLLPPVAPIKMTSSPTRHRESDSRQQWSGPSKTASYHPRIFTTDNNARAIRQQPRDSRLRNLRAARRYGYAPLSQRFPCSRPILRRQLLSPSSTRVFPQQATQWQRSNAANSPPRVKASEYP